MRQYGAGQRRARQSRTRSRAPAVAHPQSRTRSRAPAVSNASGNDHPERVETMGPTSASPRSRTQVANTSSRVRKSGSHPGTAMTTNKPLAALGQVLHDGDLAGAITDRLLARGTLRGPASRKFVS